MTTTPNLNLNLPDFNESPWHDDVNNNFRSIDAVIKSIFGIDSLQGAYVNSTAVTTGQRYFDTSTGFYYEAQSNFTTEASPTTFASERTSFPSRWELLDAAAAIDAAANAATSETNAATSATNAATSETNAATSESNASTSEANAAASAIAASNSETAAETAETNAETAETNAVAAQTAAESARDAAVAASENLAWGYTFDTGTADADPGTGKFRFNNATFMSATFMYISQNADEGDIGDVIDSWDNSTNDTKATIRVRNPAATTNWLELQITGGVTDAGSYWKVPITPIASSGSIANETSVLLGAQKHGDAGTAAVDSFNGRTGVVVPATGDYSASNITNNSTVTGTNVDNALEGLQTLIDALEAGTGLEAGSIATTKLADNLLTLAKMEHGTSGDILYYGASGEPFRLAKGTDDQILKLVSGLPSWADSNTVDTALMATAWGRCTANPAAVDFEENIASITDLGTGYFRLTFDTAMDNTNYAVVGTIETSAGSGSVYVFTVQSKTTTSFEVRTRYANASAGGVSDYDFNFVVFGGVA